MTSENPENPIDPQQSAPYAGTETSDHKDKPDPPIPPAVAIPDSPPPPPKHCEITANIKRDRIDWWTLRLEGFGLFVLIVYTIFTGLMYCANKKAADAAESAATTAKEAVHLSERAYVTWFAPLIDASKKILSVAINNSGRIPSGPAQIIPHTFVVPIQDPHAPTIDLKTASEKHWHRERLDAVQPGTPFTLTLPLHDMNAHLLETGHQQIVIVGYITYNDGFSKTPDQQWNFCFVSVYHTVLKQIAMKPCDFGTFITAAIAADGFPSNEDP